MYGFSGWGFIHNYYDVQRVIGCWSKRELLFVLITHIVCFYVEEERTYYMSYVQVRPITKLYTIIASNCHLLHAILSNNERGTWS
jgi:hypothetical protein